MTNVLLIGLRVNWLLSRGSVGLRGGQWKRVGGKRQHSGWPAPYCQGMRPLDTIQHCLCKIQQDFTFHVTPSQKKSHNHHPIKKLCIIYHVVWQHNQIEYDLQLNLRNFPSASKDGGEYIYNPILSFINLTLDFILCSLKKKKNYMWLDFTTSADMINAAPPEMWWQFLNTGPLMTKLKYLTSLLCKASTKRSIMSVKWK